MFSIVIVLGEIFPLNVLKWLEFKNVIMNKINITKQIIVLCRLGVIDSPPLWLRQLYLRKIAIVKENRAKNFDKKESLYGSQVL